MSQLAASDGQPGNWEEPDFFLRRLEIARFQEKGWQEPYESRGSRGVLRGTGGETPPVYPTMHSGQTAGIGKLTQNLKSRIFTRSTYHLTTSSYLRMYNRVARLELNKESTGCITVKE